MPRLSSARRLFLLISLSAQLTGVWLAGLALRELFIVESRASLVLDVLRWPAIALLCVAILLGLLAAWQDTRGSRPPLSARILRDLFILLVLAVVAQILLSRTYKPILFQLCFASALGGYCALRLLDSRRAIWQSQRWWRGMELTLFCACSSLVFLELGLRAAAQVMSSPLLSRDTESVKTAMQRYRFAPGALHFGFPCNTTSHYDEEFQRGDRATVVSIGDSFSFGVVPHRYHFTTVCERKLEGVAVHNLGYVGIGPGGYLRLLETEGIQLRPDLVVVDLFIGNDLSEVMRWNASTSLAASICDRRNVLAYLLPLRLMRYWRGGRGLAEIGQLPPSLRGEAKGVRGPKALLSAYPWLGDPALEIASMSEQVFQDLECERAVRNHQAEGFGGYRFLFECLRRMRALLGDIPLCVMMIPDQYQIDDRLWAEMLARLGRDVLDREGPQRRISAFLARNGISYLDLLPPLSAVLPLADGKRHLYHLRDTHFNARGNAVTGALLSRFLRGALAKSRGK